jgi:hypothetical protein
MNSPINCLDGIGPIQGIKPVRMQFEAYELSSVGYGWSLFNRMQWYNKPINQIGFIAALYAVICTLMLDKNTRINKTRKAWLLFGHATAIFVCSTTFIGLGLKFFEVAYVTCWEPVGILNDFTELFQYVLIWLQDGILVRILCSWWYYLCTY